MKLVFFGTPQFAVPTLERLLQQPGFEVGAVVTQPDKRRGRGNQLSPSPVKAIALQHSLPIYQPRRLKKAPTTLEALRQSRADAFVVVAYGQILSQEILEMPRLGCVNGHGSILPQYRGAAPIQWCLYQGEAETGITTMLMDAGMDTGAMLLKATTPIGLLDNAVDLAEKLAAQSAELMVETLLGLDAGTIQPIPQDDAAATYAPLIQKENYDLDWQKAAIALHNQIRGFYPNCVARFRDLPLKLLATVPLGSVDPSLLPPRLQSSQSEWLPWLESTAAPGSVVGVLKNQGAVVQTGQGLLLLSEVQLPGKRAQNGWDFVNGNRISVGEQLQ